MLYYSPSLLLSSRSLPPAYLPAGPYRVNIKMASKKGSRGSTHLSSSTFLPNSPLSSTSEEESMYSANSPKRAIRKDTEQRRRVMMNQYFDELVMMLSVVSDRVAPRKLDKATTLQEAVRAIRQYYNLDKADVKTSDTDYRPGFLNRGEVLHFLLNALSAFLMVVCESGRILYSTDLIASLTGHLPTRLIGQNVYDYIHEEDKNKLVSVFKAFDEDQGIAIPGSPIIGYPSKHFNCRFKLYTTESSMIDPSKDFTCLAYLRRWREAAMEDASPPSPSHPTVPASGAMESQSCMLLLVKTSSDLSHIDQPITTNEVNFSFDMRVSKEGKVLEMDKHASLVLGYTSWELVGSSFFDYIHPYHIQMVGESMTAFLKKGLGVSQPYRVRSKSNQYLWVVSKGYLSYNPWNHKPDHILLQSKVLGSDEVLPEYRFASSAHVKPDMQRREEYSPPPVTPHGMSAPVSQPYRATELPHHYQMPQQQPQQLPHHLLQHHPPLQHHQQQQPLLQQAVQQGGIPSQLETMSPLYSGNSSTSLVSEPLSSNPGTPGTSVPSNLDEIRRQLEQKNRELFEMQCKMLAQQQLFEQERNQFYQLTNHVMHYIGNQGQSPDGILPPGMAIAVSNAGSVSSRSTTPSPLPTSHSLPPSHPLPMSQLKQTLVNTPSCPAPLISSPSPSPTHTCVQQQPSSQQLQEQSNILEELMGMSPQPYPSPSTPHSQYPTTPTSTQHSSFSTPHFHHGPPPPPSMPPHHPSVIPNSQDSFSSPVHFNQRQLGSLLAMDNPTTPVPPHPHYGRARTMSSPTPSVHSPSPVHSTHPPSCIPPHGSAPSPTYNAGTIYTHSGHAVSYTTPPHQYGVYRQL